MLIKTFEYLMTHQSEFFGHLVTHLQLAFIPVAAATLVAIPLGILATRVRWLETPVMSLTGLFQVIPSLALLALLIPLFGIGSRPAMFAIFVYAVLPVVRNTATGINNVDAGLKKAARGLGLTSFQLLTLVELPLAFPVIMAAIRTTLVMSIGVATLAPLIGAGGLGEFIVNGLNLVRDYLILAGAIPAAVLALVTDWIMGLLEDRATPRGLKI